MGYPVAKISRFSYEEGKPFAEVKAVPLAALDRLRYLLLLWPEPATASAAQAVLPAASAAVATLPVTPVADKPKVTPAAAANKPVPDRKAAPVRKTKSAHKVATNTQTAPVTVQPVSGRDDEHYRSWGGLHLLDDSGGVVAVHCADAVGAGLSPS